jgi:hypothetical protein
VSKIAEMFEQRIVALEAAMAEIGHTGGPPLDDDEPAPPKRKADLIPDKEVARRYGVSVRTVERWSANPGLGFPAAIYIRHRRYRSVDALDAWDRDCVHRVTDPHSPHLDVAQALPRARAGRFNKPSKSAEQNRGARALKSHG